MFSLIEPEGVEIRVYARHQIPCMLVDPCQESLRTIGLEARASSSLSLKATDILYMVHYACSTTI